MQRFRVTINELRETSYLVEAETAHDAAAAAIAENIAPLVGSTRTSIEIHGRTLTVDGEVYTLATQQLNTPYKREGV